MRRPVVKLERALYGHPDAGTLWEKHCDAHCIDVGFTPVQADTWPSFYYHEKLKIFLVVYVDDFKMAGPKDNLKTAWALLREDGPTTKGLANIETWIGKDKWDLIHFNWGLHDLKYMGPNGENLYPKEKGGKPQVPIKAYEENLEKLVIRLKKTGAKLIWRNTTPIPPGSKGRYVGDSIRYNEIAARIMKISSQALFDLIKAGLK